MVLIARNGFYYPYEFIDAHSQPTFTAHGGFLFGGYFKGISDKDYKHAQNGYTTFRCKDLGAYHLLYLITNVRLFADISETCRTMLSEYFC